MPTDPFPFSVPNALLSPVSGRFSIKKRPGHLVFTQQCPGETETIHTLGHLVPSTDQFKQGRQPILKPRDASADTSRSDATCPTHQTRDAKSPFVVGTLAATQPSRTVEKLRICPPQPIVQRSIVTGEYHECILLQSQISKDVEHSSNLSIQS